MKMGKNSGKYLLALLGCLLLQYTPLTAASNQERINNRTTFISHDEREKTAGSLINPSRTGITLVADINPINYLFQFTNNSRTSIRVIARHTHHHFSIEKIILLHSSREKSLSRIYIRKHFSNFFLFFFPSCKYYVFALRKIII
ncbi:MAG: hypothetical protein LBT24_03375 [Tannerella sp.]|jgi:hypothetical protein|nr:hypothetical protein [Tannerella sp.]